MKCSSEILPIAGMSCASGSVSPAGPTRNGVVLIVVLVLVVMMSLAGFGFMNRMATEYEATLTNADSRQAQQTLASAETFAIYLAEEYAGVAEPYNPFSGDPELFSSLTVREATGDFANIPRSSTSRFRRWRFSIVNRLPDSTSRVEQYDEFQEASVTPSIRFGLKNESDKLHLGRVMLWDSEIPGAGRKALLQIPGMTPQAADSILDWIDADAAPREFGAEQEHYSQLDRPYAPRNGLPESLEELLFVKGVTREAFFGNEQTPELDRPAESAWNDLLTIHSGEPNTDRYGTDRVDLNEVYPSEHSNESTEAHGKIAFLSDELVKYILLARLHGISILTEADDVPATLLPANAAQSDVSASGSAILHDESLDLQEISSLADLLESVVRLPVAAGGDLVRSPLRVSGTDFLETMKLLEERVTTDFDRTLIGRININTASQPVLQALIGNAGVASRIVQQRRMVESAERSTTAWLLTQQIVDLPTYRRIYPHITTRGAVHSGEIVVYRQFGGPFLRRRLIIDASSLPARRVVWWDLTAHGLPVATSALRYRNTEFSDGLTEPASMTNTDDGWSELD